MFLFFSLSNHLFIRKRKLGLDIFKKVIIKSFEMDAAILIVHFLKCEKCTHD